MRNFRQNLLLDLQMKGRSIITGAGPRLDAAKSLVESGLAAIERQSITYEYGSRCKVLHIKPGPGWKFVHRRTLADKIVADCQDEIFNGELNPRDSAAVCAFIASIHGQRGTALAPAVLARLA